MEKIHQRLLRAAAALNNASIPYAVVGGNAVAAWVSRVDEAAVRNTRDVDILLRREDLSAATVALAAAGFVYRHAKGLDMFLDGPEAKARDAVHVVFAGERPGNSPVYTPDVSQSESTGPFRLIALEPLVEMKLAANRDKDRMHLRDLIEVGLVDASWPDRLHPELAERLRHVLQNE